jgi:hypothetical protein
MENNHQQLPATSASSKILAAFLSLQACATYPLIVAAASARCASVAPGDRSALFNLSCRLLFRQDLWVIFVLLPILVTLAGALLTIRKRSDLFVERACILGMVVGIVLPLPLYVGK